jgi:Fe-Mn family superoxide dismutase
MTYTLKPLPFDPKNIKGFSEKLLVSHYENNYSGAVRRLNTIIAQLAELDFTKAPVFVISGLKREELIATNSMILHELYFDASAEPDHRMALWRKQSRGISAALTAGGLNSPL